MMRRLHRRVFAGFGSLLVLLVASSCSVANGGINPTTSTSPTTTPVLEESARPSASPSPSHRTPEQQAKVEVLALVEHYYLVENALAADPKAPLKRYYEVAAGDYLDVLLRNAQARRAKDYRVVGAPHLRQNRVESLQLNGQEGKVPSSIVRTCLDVSDVDVVDSSGKSVVERERADAYRERLTLEKKKYGWRVVDAENSGASTCGG
jgi:hypothetical protein